MISGAVMFPVYNNRLMPSQADAELSANGCHVGQGGGGPHCHAEGFESQGVLGVYNDAEYKGKDSGLEGFGAAADSYRVRSLILGAYKGKLTGTPYFVSKKSGDGATLLGGIYTPSGNRRYSDSHPPPSALNSATVCSSASALLVTRWLSMASNNSTVAVQIGSAQLSSICYRFTPIFPATKLRAFP